MLAETGKRTILGILGGVGPLASSEFIKTIYEYSSGEHEQDSPIILMHSDPTFPDRTEAFLGGANDAMLGRLTQALYRLIESGAPRVVICCVTMHYLLPRLPADLRKRIVSLVDVVFEDVLRSRKKHLLICSTGARRLEIFQNHERWPLARDFIILPDDADQCLIHRDLIYQIKKNCDLRKLVPIVESLLSRYATDSFIAGCTEIHLLAKHFMTSDDNRGRLSCIDPLIALAKQVALEKR
jgi:aspartate racemase